MQAPHGQPAPSAHLRLVQLRDARRHLCDRAQPRRGHDEPPAAVLDFYEPDEVETLARAAELGAHRAARPDRIGEQELAARRREDSQDADLYRIAAYTGLRLGELLALRWEDVNLDLRRLVVHRALSAGFEGPTKGWQARFVPLSDGVADALARLHERGEFTSTTDYVFCNRFGRPLDGAALRRRFKRTAAAAGLRVLGFHALRHGAGSVVGRRRTRHGLRCTRGHAQGRPCRAARRRRCNVPCGRETPRGLCPVSGMRAC